MKNYSKVQPQETEDLGNGTYYKNTNIVQVAIPMGIDGSTMTVYEYDSELRYWPVDPGVPEVVAAYRIRAVTEVMGLKPSIDAFVNSLAGNEGVFAREAWYGGTTIFRSSPTIQALKIALGLTKEQIDDIFISAAAIQI